MTAGVFSFGTSGYLGSLGGPGKRLIFVAIAPAKADGGYTLLDSAGGNLPVWECQERWIDLWCRHSRLSDRVGIELNARQKSKH